MKQLKRLLREPLLHFMVIGSLLFALYSAVSGPAPAPANSIVVAPEEAHAGRVRPKYFNKGPGPGPKVRFPQNHKH
jgi:hypothetical protein